MSDPSPPSTDQRLVTGTPAQPQPAMLGRFELRRILGQGAQSVVWLAFDPRLEREVAIKLMKLGKGTEPWAIPQWLQEARSVSRLTHPNIVPVFEADVQDQQPYLVFEYVPGQTLSSVLGKRGALPAAEAVALVTDMLDALVVAHAAGVVHRDLKPSNVLVDESGRARVMDFGIAARVQEEGKGGSGAPDVGTPGYMSPEAARGAPATPSMDIFSAGMVLAEMLVGKPLIAERDAYRAIYRVLHEQVALPADLGGVDDWLRAILVRALAREPLQRHASAAVFRSELAKWSGTAPPGEAAETEAVNVSHGNATLDFLLRRMRHKSDFPAMSHSVVRIQGIATSETESVGSVTNEILKDVGLTNKLLRLVNSAFYARGGGSIGTVSRAVSLVGFNGIRNMALSLVLLEHMQDKTHAGVLKEEFLRSLMAGAIASEIGSATRDGEEAFIGSMFQNLGRLLAEYYFPEEARVVRGLMASTRQPLAEATASASVLGLSFEALGLGVAKVWGLPDSIRRCMRKPAGEPPARAPVEAVERLRWIAVAANEMADTLLRTGPRELDARMARVAQRYCRTMGIGANDVLSATVVARMKLIELAAAMDLNTLPGSAASRLLLAPADPSGVITPPSQAAPPDMLAPLELHATQPMPQPTGAMGPRDTQHVAEMLAAGIQDITNAMVEDFKLTDVLRMILETMFRAMGFQHIVFCMRDAKTDTLTGRFGLGEGVEVVVKAFTIKIGATAPDLFAAVCLRGADTMIGDATEPRIADRLPAWYRKTVDAPTFLLLPLTLKGKPFGLIYADKPDKSALSLGEKELALLRTLRNQAVMAFKQSK